LKGKIKTYNQAKCYTHRIISKFVTS